MIIRIFCRRVPWNNLILFIQDYIMGTKYGVRYHCQLLRLTLTGYNNNERNDKNHDIFHNNAGINFIGIITDLKRQYRSIFVFQ